MAARKFDPRLAEITPAKGLAGWRREFCGERLGDDGAALMPAQALIPPVRRCVPCEVLRRRLVGMQHTRNQGVAAEVKTLRQQRPDAAIGIDGMAVGKAADRALNAAQAAAEGFEVHIELHRAAVLGDRVVVVGAGKHEMAAVTKPRADRQAFPLLRRHAAQGSDRGVGQGAAARATVRQCPPFVAPRVVVEVREETEAAVVDERAAGCVEPIPCDASAPRNCGSAWTGGVSAAMAAVTSSVNWVFSFCRAECGQPGTIGASA